MSDVMRLMQIELDARRDKIREQEQTITQQAQELQCERDKIASMRNSFPVDAASWRGVDELDVCAECGGAGTKLYGNTSTYHYSVGGQAMTLSVCDKCWGSGNKQKPWRSWKLVEQQAQELEGQAARIDALRSHLSATIQGRDAAVKEMETYRKEYLRYKPECEDLQQQLADSQARCREMVIALSHARPRDMQPVTVYTINSIISAGHSEHATFVLEMNYRAKEQQLAQLQATLAAREVEVDRLKLAQQHSIQDECEAEQRLIDAGISDYEDGGQGEYRGLLTQIDLCIKERDAAVQEAGRLKLTWTTAWPTVAGGYWVKRMFDGYPTYNVMDVTEHGAIGPYHKPLDECIGWEFAGPIPLPTEPQQARGSSGGVANHGAGA